MSITFVYDNTKQRKEGENNNWIGMNEITHFSQLSFFRSRKTFTICIMGAAWLSVMKVPRICF